MLTCISVAQSVRSTHFHQKLFVFERGQSALHLQQDSVSATKSTEHNLMKNLTLSKNSGTELHETFVRNSS